MHAANESTCDLPYVLALDAVEGCIRSCVFSPSGARATAILTARIDSRGSAHVIHTTLVDTINRELPSLPGNAPWRLALSFPEIWHRAETQRLHEEIRSWDYQRLHEIDLNNTLRTRLTRAPERIIVRPQTEVVILGEAHSGTGSSVLKTLGITIGARLGSVFLVDGMPVSEGEGVPTGAQLGDCDFEGKRADDLFSERGLRAMARASGFPHDDSLSLTALADLGEPAAQELWRSYGEDLGRFIRPYASAFGAETILISGGLSASWPFFGATLNRMLAGIPALHGRLGISAALEGLCAIALHPTLKKHRLPWSTIESVRPWASVPFA